MPFIDLTICASYDDAYNDEVLKKYGMKKGKYRRSGHYAPTNGKDDNINLREVFNSVSYEPHEILDKIEFNTKDRTKTNFAVDFTGDSSNITENGETRTVYENAVMHTVYWANFGRCYVFRPRDHVLKAAILGANVWAKMSIYVYFGYPGQFMFNTKEKVFIN